MTKETDAANQRICSRWTPVDRNVLTTAEASPTSDQAKRTVSSTWPIQL